MEEQRTRYPAYNVLQEKEAWDHHTREIVLRRMGPFDKPKFLTEDEVNLLKSIAGHLVYDNRPDILAYVVHYFDSKLAADIGEDQRKPGVPKEKDLIRLGLRAIQHLSKAVHGANFPELAANQQFDLLAALQRGQAPVIPDWQRVPQKALFKKLVSVIVGAYYSHPVVWSEIGYGGPAYPRGYVRVEHGLTDPWEARRDAE